ncbi:asparagine synthetase A [Verminephrobacter aporrectodeae]|uniref:Asparaginase n=1 Tax=Verminephrobacter aporrectodeae subsp. tuberculatae TaxID=1110392 RepID=A0ABT3KXZ5_9BURK|nr:asparagine synthetase A [Verminephrobacter aporrectodeae]MCW5256430.1 asparaginase [Verminephrobacter aporrectodeae subsp. tuberculatae]MCW5323207.1 asparaginase [Verminephrobacter aporrectodeae subsp. tuberculatae]MCW8177273.1 asparaginase [Verminephrobacter aporrectodeae subsp. tuberculatae]MCW8200345.1 asparaginase [Verminephrobacter aporrectodeae subsp. tuberculatae]MCW8204693.1 asparaginase [Verminephrobacter aporrectodeae subsp. tuberculatae]
MINIHKSWLRPAQHYIEAMNSDWYRALLILQSDIARFTEEFFRKRGMHSTMLPITTTSISSPMGLGSDSLPVSIEINGERTYLADSMQFMLEYALRLEPQGVFYIMPSFRGEDHDTRHLNQFYHSEVEICGDLQEVMGLVNQYVFFLASMLLKHSREALVLAGMTHPAHIEKFVLANGKIPEVRFSDAVLELDMDPCYVQQSQKGFLHITNLGEKVLIKNYGGVVWLTHMPTLGVPFYQADDPGDPEHSLTADLLMGFCETVGCGERHTTQEDVRKALARHQVAVQDYEWYITMKKLRPMHTSGFGMGVERFILWLLDHDDIRDCQILPRLNGLNIIP